MSSYLGAIEGRELESIVFYIKSLSDEFAAQAEQEAAAELEQQLSETEGEADNGG